jgi:hypothetical protein
LNLSFANEEGFEKLEDYDAMDTTIIGSFLNDSKLIPT